MPALDTKEYEAAAILQYLQASGTISLEDTAKAMKQAELKKILDAHPFPITQGKDGRWRTYVKPEGEKRKQIAKSTLEKVYEALEEFYKPEQKKAKQKVTLTALYPKWTEYKSLHGASSSYMKRIDSNWRTHYEGTEIVERPIEELTKLDLDVWAHKLIEETHHVKKEYYNVSMIMRQMLDYAVDLEIIPKNPLQQVKINAKMMFTPTKKKSSETQVFTKQEVEALYAEAWKEYDQELNTVHKLVPLAVIFQFLTGVRIGELCALRYEDIVDSEIYVNRMFRYDEHEVVEYTKSHNAGRYVPLTASARELIQEAKSYQQEHGLCDEGYIFSVNEEPLSYYAVRKAYQRYCEKIGTINKSSHKSRKTYISALIDGGVNINVIREMVGHADERTTFNSYCFDRKTKAERVEQIEEALA